MGSEEVNCCPMGSMVRAMRENYPVTSTLHPDSNSFMGFIWSYQSLVSAKSDIWTVVSDVGPLLDTHAEKRAPVLSLRPSDPGLRKGQKREGSRGGKKWVVASSQVHHRCRSYRITR